MLTLDQPWDFPVNGYECYPSFRDSFCPPIPLSSQPIRCKEGRYSLEPDGFETDWLLVYPWELEDDNEE